MSEEKFAVEPSENLSIDCKTFTEDFNNSRGSGDKPPFMCSCFILAKE